MKRMRTTIALLVVAVLAAVTLGISASASSASPSAGEKNIVQTVLAAGQFTTLASLLTKAGLVDTLRRAARSRSSRQPTRRSRRCRRRRSPRSRSIRHS